MYRLKLNLVVFVTSITLFVTILLVGEAWGQPLQWGTVLIFCGGPNNNHTNPTWRDNLIDPVPDNSFPNYFQDCTSNQHLISEDAACYPTGDIVYIATCQPITAYPWYPGEEFLTSVLDLADEDIDFSQYDCNNDSIVDKVFFMIMSDHIGEVGRAYGYYEYVTYEGDTIKINSCAAVYHIYRSNEPYFDVSGLTPIGDSNISEYLDEDILEEGFRFYRVTWE